MRIFFGLVSTLKMEAAGFSEMWLSIYQTMWHEIPEGCTLCICLFSVFRQGQGTGT
jgi:hypothetical protein